MDGAEMDLVTHSFNGFPAPTATEFGAFLKAVAASAPFSSPERVSGAFCTSRSAKKAAVKSGSCPPRNDRP